MPTPYMSGNGQCLRIMRRMVALTQRDSGKTTSGLGVWRIPVSMQTAWMFKRGSGASP